MMRSALTTVLLLLALFVAYSQQQCTYATVQAAITDFNAAVAAYDSTEDLTASVAAMSAAIVSLQAKLLPCYIVLGTFIGGKQAIDVDILTKGCTIREAANSTAFNNDPCCNVKLQETQCCALRKVTVRRDIPSATTPLVKQFCKNPDKVAQALRNFATVQANVESQCQAAFSKRLDDLSAAATTIYQCLQNFVSSKANCVQDSDCASGSCNLYTGFCNTPGLEMDKTRTDLAKCVQSAVNTFVLRGIALKLGLKDVSIDLQKLSDNIQDAISVPACLNDFGVVQEQYTNQTACEAVQRCTDNSGDTCSSSTSFCGAYCQKSGICLFDMGASINQTVCSQFGKCYEKYKELPGWISQSECQAKSVCIGAANGCTNCDTDQATCQQSGRCIGFPGLFNSNAPTQLCVKAELGFKSCAVGFAFDSSLGLCVAIAADATACAVLGGTMSNIPTTQAACESYKICREPSGVVSRKNPTDCTNCGGQSVNIFKWLPAKYAPRPFRAVGTWTQRKPVSAYRWVSTLDLTKFSRFVATAQSNNYRPFLKSALQCQFGPMTALIKRVICDCATDGPGDCWKDPIVSDVGTLQAFAGIAVSFEFPEVSITTTSTSVSATSGSVTITVKKTEVTLNIQASTSRSSLQSTTTPPSILRGAATVGQVAGAGYALSEVPGPITMCINRDPTFNVATDKYPAPVFCVKDSTNTNFLISDAPITNKGSTTSQICGTVQSKDTFYPCFATQAAADSPDVKLGKTNSASSISVSTMLIFIIVAFVTFVTRQM